MNAAQTKCEPVTLKQHKRYLFHHIWMLKAECEKQREESGRLTSEQMLTGIE